MSWSDRVLKDHARLQGYGQDPTGAQLRSIKGDHTDRSPQPSAPHIVGSIHGHAANGTRKGSHGTEGMPGRGEGAKASLPDGV